MIEERLPLNIEPERFAKANRACSGQIAFDQMAVLCESLHETDGNTLVGMQFSLNEEGRVTVEMGVKATLVLTCQRCLSGVEYEVDTQTTLTPIKNESEAGDLPAHLEAFLMEEDFISPIKLVEENLLLEVPIVPMHAEETCNEALANMAEPEAPKRENPFDVLAELKETLD